MGCSGTLLRKYTSSTTGVGPVGHGCRTRGARKYISSILTIAPFGLTFFIMAFLKKTKMKINGKWYPKSVLVMSPATTDQVAKRLAAESTVSPADVRAVLTALGGVMGDFMAQGRSVKLDGVGSFYFTAVTTANGVATEKEVSVNQIKGVRVRFIPETRYRGAGKGRVSTRSLSDVDIDWEEWKGEEKGAEPKKPGGGGEQPHP